MKIKVVKAKHIYNYEIKSLCDVYFIECINEDMIKKHFENNTPILLMDEDKNTIYLNPKYIMGYMLYDELAEIEV